MLEQVTYQNVLVQLIDQFTYAMDPNQVEDRLVIDNTPKLYFDALANTSGGDVMNDDIICALILGIFKNYANILKDQLAATGQSPYISKKWVESYAVWSTVLLNITLEGRYYDMNSIRCYDKSPMELACSLMLHKVISMLLMMADVEQLYNCLILLAANSDIEGFDMVWRELCHRQDCNDPCEVFRRPLLGGVISLKDINISILDVATFHCELSNLCTILDHVILPLCPTAAHYRAHVISTLVSKHFTTLTATEKCAACGLTGQYGCHAGHGWREGFLSEDNHCQFPSLHIEELTVDVLHLFAAIGQPLVIKGVGHEWRLLTKWRRHFLQEHYGTMKVLVSGSMYYLYVAVMVFL